MGLYAAPSSSTLAQPSSGIWSPPPTLMTSVDFRSYHLPQSNTHSCDPILSEHRFPTTNSLERRLMLHAFSLTPALSRWAREGVRPPRVGGSNAGLRCSSANPLSQRERVRVRENGPFRRRASLLPRALLPLAPIGGEGRGEGASGNCQFSIFNWPFAISPRRHA